MATTVSLKVAQVASMAVVNLSAFQLEFPEIRESIALCASMLNGMLVVLSAKPVLRVGRTKLAEPVRIRPERAPRPIPVPKGVPQRKALVHEERTAWEPSSPQEASRCRALLLEVLRRAAHDWVLYRQSSRLHNKECAQDAYVWLFEEHTGHPAGKHRATAIFEFEDGDVVGVRNITSFLGICEALELDPDTVRDRVRQMNVQTIISAGRPAETRRVKRNEVSGIEEVSLSVDVNIDPNDYQYESQYEAYGNVNTPEMLSYDDVSGLY